MWETFDWKRERGGGSGRKKLEEEEEEEARHQSLLLCPKGAFRPRGQQGLDAGPRASSPVGAGPSVGKCIPKLYTAG